MTEHDRIIRDWQAEQQAERNQRTAARIKGWQQQPGDVDERAGRFLAAIFKGAERGRSGAAHPNRLPAGVKPLGPFLRNRGASGEGPNNYTPLIKGGQGRSARSLYDGAMMAAYAAGAIAAIIAAGWLLTVALGGGQ